ncbi:MAG TPA: hypothetical protein VFY60_02840 [Pyrinomonadaceae bacterium]|nr:hypothetical protein [Pyrinomonadaceae bacterium]
MKTAPFTRTDSPPGCFGSTKPYAPSGKTVKRFTATGFAEYLRGTVKRVFQLLNQMTRDGAIPNYAIGGAIAAVFYVEPFATQDIDVFVLMHAEKTGLVTKVPGWEYLKEHGYTEIRGEAIVVEDWPVQFVPVSNALEEEGYLNATAQDFAGEPVRVMLAEHLVAIMLTTGRLKDFVRAQMFFSQEAVDQDLLIDIVNRHGLQEQLADFQHKWLQ